MTVTDYVQHLNLQPHPEGVILLKRTVRMRPFRRPLYQLGSKAHGRLARPFISYWKATNFQLHRIQADEVWHFYAGDPLEIFVIDPTSEFTVIRLGNKLDQGEVLQAVVRRGCWFGSKPVPAEMAQKSGFSLVGCTVAPGFDFADFELADRAMLLNQFPQHRAIIELLTI